MFRTPIYWKRAWIKQLVRRFAANFRQVGNAKSSINQAGLTLTSSLISFLLIMYYELLIPNERKCNLKDKFFIQLW